MRHATREERLRLLLEDRDWHTQQEMQREGGMRFGARVFDLHNGREPLHYEIREGEKAGQFFYRATSKAKCSICRNPNHSRPGERLALLEVENRRLRERLAAGYGGAA